MNEIVHTLTDGLLRYLAVGSVAAVVLVVLALAFLKAARVRTPVYRHMVWLYCLMGIVGLPLIWLYGPKLTLAVLPARAQTHAALASPAVEPDMEEPFPDAGLTPPRPLTAEMSSAPQEHLLSWKTAAATAWFLGFLIMLTRLAVGWLRLRRICRWATPLPESEYPVGLARPKLRLCLTDQLPGPVCFGVFHPIILLPQDMVRGGSSENLRMVLTHELAHVERRDCWANLFQRLVEAMYFFHPLVWLASRQLTQQREEICDNHVLAEGVSADDYTTLLSHLGAQAVQAGYLQTVALFEGQLLSRIRSLLDPARSRQTKLPWRVAAIGTISVLAGFLLFGSVRLAAQPSDRATGASSEQSPSPAPATTAANNEKPEQPRYAARTFNSKMAFTVLYQATSRSSTGSLWVGRTPSATPLGIPACWVWWVMPRSTRIDWDVLAQEIRENKVPGLALVADTTITDSDLERLTGCTWLKRLTLNGAATDAGLVHLKGMTELEDLDLSTGKITDAGLAHLKDLPSLRNLQLYRTGITDAGLEHLKDMTRLQQLDLTDTRITDVGMEHLKGLTTLREIFVSRDRITDAGLVHLEGLTELQLVHLADTRITDAGLARLKGFAALQILSLNGTQVTDAGLVHLKGLAALQSLNLSSTQVTDAGLEHLRGLTKLRWLSLNGTKITDAGLVHLKGLTGLETLNLSGTQITDAGLVHFRGLSQLQMVHLSDTRITGVGLAHLHGLTRLRELDLCRTPITDASLAHLQGLTGLSILNLYGTRITDAGLEHLQGLTGLYSLFLSGTQITDAGLEYLKGLSVATILYLTDTQITDAGLEHLKGLTGLLILDLSGTQVTDTGVQQLEQNLPKVHVRRDGWMEPWIKEG